MVNGHSAEYHNIRDESTKIGGSKGLHAGTQSYVDLSRTCFSCLYFIRPHHSTR